MWGSLGRAHCDGHSECDTYKKLEAASSKDLSKTLCGQTCPWLDEQTARLMCIHCSEPESDVTLVFVLTRRENICHLNYANGTKAANAFFNEGRERAQTDGESSV